MIYFFFFKQKTAYEMRISDWSSDVCSSDLTRSSRSRARRGASAGGSRWKRSGSSTFSSTVSRGSRWKLWNTKPMRRLRMSLPASSSRVATERKSVVEGKRVYVRVDLGGRRIIKKKKIRNSKEDYTHN